MGSMESKTTLGWKKGHFSNVSLKKESQTDLEWHVGELFILGSTIHFNPNWEIEDKHTDNSKETRRAANVIEGS